MDRPKDISEMVGQVELRTQLGIVIEGSKVRGTRVPHCLLKGPAGHGKTTLAGIIANEVGGALMQATGIMLRKPQDLTGLLVKMAPNTVLFIDEIHRLPLPVMEALYEALEDNALSVMVGSGGDAQTITHRLPSWVCVGATTNPGLLSVPFRERFGFQGTVESYSVEELAEIVARAWTRAQVTYGEGETHEVASRCKGVPRLALHLAERVLDYCACQGAETVDDGAVAVALAAFGIDEQGLDRTDWRILDCLVNRFGGRTVGLEALAQALDMDRKTLEDEYEPPLVRAGLIQRTKSGRMALPAAHELYRK
jgi:Holliday junction DNA helicase RuvB